MSRLGSGLFAELLHRIGDDATRFEHRGIRYWWSECGRLCELVPTNGLDRPYRWPRCRDCFPR